MSITKRNFFFIPTYINPNEYKRYLSSRMHAYVKDTNGKKVLIATRVFRDIKIGVLNKNRELYIGGGRFKGKNGFDLPPVFPKDTEFYVELNWLNDKREIMNRILLPLNEPYVKRLSGTTDSYHIDFEVEKNADVRFNNGVPFLKLKN